MQLTIDTLVSRVGPKPQTKGPAPHQQTTEFPTSDVYARQLHEYAVGLAGVANGESRIGDGGLSAFFLSEIKSEGSSPRFLIENEFAHIHADRSHSLHLVLPTAVGLELQEKGWTEQHPLGGAGAIPDTNFILYGARNAQELNISKLILEQSWVFASNNSRIASLTAQRDAPQLRCC
jgi:hypothetical protein